VLPSDKEDRKVIKKVDVRTATSQSGVGALFLFESPRKSGTLELSR
jgi:hypothetical protein